MPAVPLLFVDHATALGGAENILLLLLEHLDRDRFVPHLAASPGLLAAAGRARGVTVHEMPLGRLRGEATAAWRFARAVRRLVQVIRRERCALICANSMRASLYAAAAAKLTRRPLLWHVHEIFAPGPYVRLMSGLCAGAIAVSASAAKPLRCAAKVRVIHNGVRPDDFAGDHRERAARLRAATLVGQVARLQPWKGQRDVIAAAEVVVSRRPNVYVAIIGGDIFGDAAAYEAELKRSVARCGLSDRIRLTGHQTDIRATLAALDIFVNASVDEPFATVLLEASAAALPIVAYASGGVPEAIVDGETGVLVPPGDHARLAAALLELIADPCRARALGEAARDNVHTRFDIRRMAGDVQEVLAALVGDAAPAVTVASGARG